MSTNYVIYLINKSTTTQNFWCFLAPPKELVDDPDVYANSSTHLSVAPNDSATNTFSIPVQYIVGAGASNNAVGLNIQINPSITQNADLEQIWDARYAIVPPNSVPTLKKSSDRSASRTIGIRSNAFNQENNEANGCFSSMTFGIKTQQGLIGMSWSPSPQKTWTLTPNLKFYVATGSFEMNKLASWTDVSNSSAEISVPDDFYSNKTTVTYTETGGWSVKPGAPPDLNLSYGKNANVHSLIQSHRLLSEAHAGLINIAKSGAVSDFGSPQIEEATSQNDTLESVDWDQTTPSTAAVIIPLSGTLTVKTALTAAFGCFVLSGVKFKTKLASKGDYSVKFTYDGEKSAETIKGLFTSGKPVEFRSE